MAGRSPRTTEVATRASRGTFARASRAEHVDADGVERARFGEHLNDLPPGESAVTAYARTLLRAACVVMLHRGFRFAPAPALISSNTEDRRMVG